MISTRRRTQERADALESAISTIAFKARHRIGEPRGAGVVFGEIHIPYWEEAGFTRRTCRVTGQFFWSRDSERDTCGDSVEDPYTFIGKPIIEGFSMRGKELKDAMREMFLSFFEQRNHERMAPYPVIARWRDDIHSLVSG